MGSNPPLLLRARKGKEVIPAITENRTTTNNTHRTATTPTVWKGNKNNKRLGEEGFTLLELLIVLAIISVLVAVSVPVFMSALERSWRAVDISNARSLRAVLSGKIIEGTVTIKDENYGICTVVDENGAKVGICNKKSAGVNWKGNMNKVALPGEMKPQGLIEGSGLEEIRIKSRRMDWYAVAVYGDGKSEYYEGNGAVRLKDENRREWGEIDK
ncbi:MAG: prepilin-type N-terminal cleavage/methylation domain-containing protein [Catonella sp.]|nr:prepilin-type N-terminal cleavage/methylation domain-containing protein [Catonella sp.]